MSGIITIITCSVFVSFLVWKYEKNTEQYFKEILDIKNNIEHLSIDLNFVEAKLWETLEQRQSHTKELMDTVKKVAQEKAEEVIKERLKVSNI